jgi:hypothetical protein
MEESELIDAQEALAILGMKAEALQAWPAGKSAPSTNSLAGFPVMFRRDEIMGLAMALRDGGIKTGLPRATGAQLIAEERLGQQEREGFGRPHDAAHDNFELSEAAIRYASMGPNGPFSHPTPGQPPQGWPFEASWWKPSRDPVRNLAKAGALIAAEIDRLQAKNEGS